MKPLPGSKLDSIDYYPETAAHQQVFDEGFQRKKTTLLDKLDRWAAAEFPQARDTFKTVFYPFSGPDFVTIQTLFPRAEQYVMLGLEIEGALPDLKAIPRQRLPVVLQNLRVAIGDNLDDTFFYTLDMSADLVRTELKGTIPIILTFMARAGCKPLAVRRFKLDSTGRPEYLPANDSALQSPKDPTVTGAEFYFRLQGDSSVKRLHYFCADVQDGNIDKLVGFKSYLSRLEPTATYLKSASYLLHGYDFAEMRGFVLDVSDFILQDDTGVPYKYFLQDNWQTQLYGMYYRPLPIFNNRYQADLRKAYLSGIAKQVNFDMGYKSGVNLLLARKRDLLGAKGNKPVQPDSTSKPPKR